jgi:hypothetical protein
LLLLLLLSVLKLFLSFRMLTFLFFLALLQRQLPRLLLRFQHWRCGRREHERELPLLLRRGGG